MLRRRSLRQQKRPYTPLLWVPIKDVPHRAHRGRGSSRGPLTDRLTPIRRTLRRSGNTSPTATFGSSKNGPQPVRAFVRRLLARDEEFVTAVTVDELLPRPDGRGRGDGESGDGGSGVRSSEDGASGGGRVGEPVLDHLDETMFTSPTRAGRHGGGARPARSRTARGESATASSTPGSRRSTCSPAKRDTYDLLGEKERLVHAHAYAADEGNAPDVEHYTVHVGETAEIRETWFVAYDGGGYDDAKRAARRGTRAGRVLRISELRPRDGRLHHRLPEGAIRRIGTDGRRRGDGVTARPSRRPFGCRLRQSSQRRDRGESLVQPRARTHPVICVGTSGSSCTRSSWCSASRRSRSDRRSSGLRSRSWGARAQSRRLPLVPSSDDDGVYASAARVRPFCGRARARAHDPEPLARRLRGDRGPARRDVEKRRTALTG